MLARVEKDPEERGSERTCAVTGQTGAPEAMLRFALSPDGVVTPDIRRKLPGRGVWTRADAATVARAAAKNAFSRGFRTQVKVSADLASEVDALLEADALQFLALVNKSGFAVFGTAKVESALRGGRVAVLLHAREAAADGSGKLDRLAHGLGSRATTINLFESSRLDLALGRSNVIHAALQAGSASKAFLAKAARLVAYRAGGEVGTFSTATGLTEDSLRRDEL